MPHLIIAEWKGCGVYDVYLDGRWLLRGRSPFFEAARFLAREGANPSEKLTMGRTAHECDLSSTIGTAAGLMAVEEDNRPPRFRKWRPSPFAGAK